MRIPFYIEFREERFDYNLSLELVARVQIHNFLMRKSVILKDARITNSGRMYLERMKEIDTIKFDLTRWFYTHLWYYSEMNRWQRFLLFFIKKEKFADGAIIKILGNKTIIMELLP